MIDDSPRGRKKSVALARDVHNSAHGFAEFLGLFVDVDVEPCQVRGVGSVTEGPGRGGAGKR